VINKVKVHPDIARKPQLVTILLIEQNGKV
jgi:hypothetical protein